MVQVNTKTGKTRQLRRADASVSAVRPTRSGRRRATRRRRVMKKKTDDHEKKKTRKVMKAKKVDNVARGKRALHMVFTGSKKRTATGIKKEDIKKNKRGKLVTVRRSAAGAKAYGNIARWVTACQKARTELGLVGFVAINKGSLFYETAKAFMV